MKNLLALLVVIFVSPNIAKASLNWSGITGEEMVWKGKYYTCPNSSDNRVLEGSKIDVGEFSFGNYPWEVIKNNPGSKITGWILVGNYKLEDPPKNSLYNNNNNFKYNKDKYREAIIPVIQKRFLEKDIRSETEYYLKSMTATQDKYGYNYLNFMNKEGKELRLQYISDNLNPSFAIDKNQNRIELYYESKPLWNQKKIRTKMKLLCNNENDFLTYKSVNLFKMLLTDEYGESYSSPYFILNIKYLIKPTYLEQSKSVDF